MDATQDGESGAILPLATQSPPPVEPSGWYRVADCVVCLDSLGGEEHVSVTPCGHVFHTVWYVYVCVYVYVYVCCVVYGEGTYTTAMGSFFFFFFLPESAWSSFL